VRHIFELRKRQRWTDRLGFDGDVSRIRCTLSDDVFHVGHVLRWRHARAFTGSFVEWDVEHALALLTRTRFHASKIFLCMGGYLRARARRDEMDRDVFPSTLAEMSETFEEGIVLFDCPRRPASCRALGCSYHGARDSEDARPVGESFFLGGKIQKLEISNSTCNEKREWRSSQRHNSTHKNENDLTRERHV